MSFPTSPNISEKDEILDPIDAEVLQQKGLVGPVLSGSRQISQSLLYSDPEIDDIDPGDPTIEIPVFLQSWQTLKYLGFEESKAKEIWQVWTNLGSDGQLEDLVDFAIGVVRKEDEDIWNNQDDEWRRHMERMGINRQTIDAIMHPECKDIRLTGSCNYWVQDTIQGRYEVLLALQRTSRIRGELVLQEACEDAAGEGQPLAT